MTSRIIVLLASILLIQYAQSDDAQDPRIKACAKKIWEQVGQLQFGKVPLCMDIEKLKKVTAEANIFEEFHKEVPDKCKKLSTENVGECFQILSGLINDKSDDLKTSILNSIKGVIGSFSGCYQVFINRMTNLDKFIANGCED